MIVNTKNEIIITLSWEEAKLLSDILIDESDIDNPTIDEEHSNFADQLSDLMLEADDSLRS